MAYPLATDTPTHLLELVTPSKDLSAHFAEFSPQRILWMPLRFIGDTVLSIPLLRQIRAAWPTAEIDVWVSKTTAPLLDPCPYLNRIVVEPKGFKQRLNALKRREYDLVFLMRKSVSMAWMLQLAEAQHVIGYDKQRWFWPFGFKRTGQFLDVTLPYPGLRTLIPQSLSHLSLLMACGIPHDTLDDRLELWTTQGDRTQVTELLASHGIEGDRPFAVFNGASASHGKGFDKSKFLEALFYLSRADVPIVATGAASDCPLYEEYKTGCGVPLINLAGQTTLRQSVALFQRAALMVSVDSGPVHMAAAAGTPHIVAVYGPTNASQWGHGHRSHLNFQAVYRDMDCRPCYAKVCDHNRCKTHLPAESVLEAVEQAVQAIEASDGMLC